MLSTVNNSEANDTFVPSMGLIRCRIIQFWNQWDTESRETGETRQTKWNAPFIRVQGFCGLQLEELVFPGAGPGLHVFL